MKKYRNIEKNKALSKYSIFNLSFFRINNTRYLTLFIIVLYFVSCDTTSSNLDLNENCSENIYLEEVSSLLSNFETDIILSLNESQSTKEFDKNIHEKIELKYGKSKLKSSITDENISEKELLISKALNDLKASIYYGYDETNVNGSKEEFFEYIESRKANFVNEVELMSFLDNQKEKDIMIALMYMEVGSFEIMANHFDEIIALDQDSSKTVLKSVNSCNWWCRTKKYAECVLLTQGTALGAVLLLFGPPPIDLLGGLIVCGISIFALDCWQDYFYNYI